MTFDDDASRIVEGVEPDVLVVGQLAHFLDEFDAVHAGHVEVGDQQDDLDATLEILESGLTERPSMNLVLPGMAV